MKLYIEWFIVYFKSYNQITVDVNNYNKWVLDERLCPCNYNDFLGTPNDDKVMIIHEEVVIDRKGKEIGSGGSEGSCRRINDNRGEVVVTTIT